MKSKVFKVLSNLIVFVCVFMISISFTGVSVYADEKVEASDALNFLKSTPGTGSAQIEAAKNSINGAGKNIHTLIQTVVVIVGALILMIYGLQIMLAGSDSNKKRELKDKAVNYVTGAFLCFGSAFVYKLVITFVNSF